LHQLPGARRVQGRGGQACPLNASRQLAVRRTHVETTASRGRSGHVGKPNPAVITTLRPDGQPVATATWYPWDDGRVLVNMDEDRKRLEHIRNDPRVALDVLDEGGWGTHVSIIGHIDEMREDTGLADIDRIAGHYIGRPYPQRDRRRISAWIAVDGWHGWGALKDNSQAAG
jgi:PPOX class probable F420-dependent enzyme